MDNLEGLNSLCLKWVLGFAMVKCEDRKKSITVKKGEKIDCLYNP
jgi:hypothetical protein